MIFVKMNIVPYDTLTCRTSASFNFSKILLEPQTNNLKDLYGRRPALVAKIMLFSLVEVNSFLKESSRKNLLSQFVCQTKDDMDKWKKISNHNDDDIFIAFISE